MHKLFCSVMACWALAAAGCQDPGCIRNSQCKSGYECKDNKCVAPDAGAADGGVSASGKGGSAASLGKGGSSGVSAGKSGSSSSTGGQGATVAKSPDAGSM